MSNPMSNRIRTRKRFATGAFDEVATMYPDEILFAHDGKKVIILNGARFGDGVTKPYVYMYAANYALMYTDGVFSILKNRGGTNGAVAAILHDLLGVKEVTLLADGDISITEEDKILLRLKFGV